MTRDEMLAMLSTVQFEMIWPGSWEDIGFTEREIWVNDQGYGYVACDEVTGYFIGDGIESEKWCTIREKLKNDELEAADIESTSLAEMLDQFFCLEYQEAIDRGYLDGLLQLSPTSVEKIYCMQTDDAPKFFDTKEDLDCAYERDWCHYRWDELDDDILKEWIERLF